MTIKDDQMIAIGRITRARGIRGEVSVEPLTNDPARFLLLDSVTVEKNNHQSQVLRIEKVQVLVKHVIIKFADIANRSEAEEYRGALVKIARKQCLPLEPGSYYIFDLVGLRVETINGEAIGELTDVMTLPANDVYVVRNDEAEYLIPALDDVIKKVDLDNNVMVIDPIEGLLK